MDDPTSPERWLPVPIPPFGQFYEVSDQGRVRSLDRDQRIGYGATRRIFGQILSPGRTKSGHLHVSMSAYGESKTCTVHRLVALAFLGDPEPGQEVRHWPDRDPTNNRLDNLRWGTRLENAQDRLAHGTDSSTNKTHCPYGHEYTQENTLVEKSGSRSCRICKRRRFREWYHKKKNVY